jgi:hypothetical protein
MVIVPADPYLWPFGAIADSVALPAALGGAAP